MKKLLLSLALLMSNTVFSANWIKIGEISTEGLTYYIDTDSIKKLHNYNSQQVRYFVKYDYQKAQKNSEGKYYNYAIDQWKVDCTDGKASLSAFIHYTRNGSVIDFASIPIDNWQIIYPETIAANEMKFICNYIGN